MTPQQIEALKLALEALEPFTTPNWAGSGVDKCNEAITAIKEALAQPEQEPVVSKWSLREVYFDEDGEPLAHRSPPEQEPVALHIGWLVRNSQGKLDLLTELQIDSSLEKYERLHKLYTRPPQRTEQEPVGMVKDLFTSTAWEKLDLRGSTKVYLDIPPQRTEQEENKHD